MLKRLCLAAAVAGALVLEAPAGEDGATGPVAAAQAALAADLIARIGAGAPSESVVVSPAGVAAALSVAATGASDEMRGAIARSLGFGADAGGPDALLDAVSALPAGPSEPLTLALRIVFDESLPLKPDAPTLLADHAVDHAIDDLTSGAGVERINAWVKDATGGAVPALLDAPPGTGFVGLSALRFKGAWQVAFDPGETAPMDFNRAAGTTVSVPMMHRPPGPGRFRADDRFSAVDLPYAGERYALVVVAARAAEGIRPADLPALGAWLQATGFKEGRGEVLLPRLRLDDGRELLGALDEAGLAPARIRPGAFAGFADGPLEIRRIVQRTVLEIDEAGTTAAAATAVIAERSLDPGLVRVVADAPFVVALRDRTTGLILLAALVGDPTGPSTP